VKKILLTGSTGFIGSTLVKVLSKKYLIYIILRKKNRKFSKNKNIIKIKYNNLKNLNNKLRKLKINTVVHCATHYVKNHNFEDIKKLSDSNILFGNIILENLKKMGVKKFINFSTVWENYDGKKGNYFNLYSAYKASFVNIINYYKKKLNNIKFINLAISDTFGQNDKRKKIINVLRDNYKKNYETKVVSKNLYMNLLNVADIKNAIYLILERNYQSGEYLLENNKSYKIFDIVKNINNNNSKKIKVKWLSNKVLKEKSYKFKVLKDWKPANSKIGDIVRTITE
tara:strand:- start:523 stop:1374 length:852 start_codon:yes stop_codon:yes gene_type:complete